MLMGTPTNLAPPSLPLPATIISIFDNAPADSSGVENRRNLLLRRDQPKGLRSLLVLRYHLRPAIIQIYSTTFTNVALDAFFNIDETRSPNQTEQYRPFLRPQAVVGTELLRCLPPHIVDLTPGVEPPGLVSAQTL